ncbi:hypothetical protein EKO04_005089 [Ascochyta lentis]|uniref:Uncharacterized protein n=1 Tax=Ascochyta lentis TaxID=205686 RepID=A0A8H7MJR1_9PLEO|nr:hypothetical protein EKO04_005089 [Ascochyta lentis]
MTNTSKATREEGTEGSTVLGGWRADEQTTAMATNVSGMLWLGLFRRAGEKNGDGRRIAGRGGDKSSPPAIRGSLPGCTDVEWTSSGQSLDSHWTVTGWDGLAGTTGDWRRESVDWDDGGGSGLGDWSEWEGEEKERASWPRPPSLNGHGRASSQHKPAQASTSQHQPSQYQPSQHQASPAPAPASTSTARTAPSWPACLLCLLALPACSSSSPPSPILLHLLSSPPPPPPNLAGCRRCSKRLSPLSHLLSHLLFPPSKRTLGHPPLHVNGKHGSPAVPLSIAAPQHRSIAAPALHLHKLPACLLACLPACLPLHLLSARNRRRLLAPSTACAALTPVLGAKDRSSRPAP